MNIQMQTYSSAMNVNDIDVSDFDGEFELLGSAALVGEEGLSICGLSDAMMDDLREMVIY